MNQSNQQVYNRILEVFDGLENNNFSIIGRPDTPMWDRPLIGVAAGNDPYFEFLKDHIGAFHWSPAEVFALKYGAAPEASELRVLSVIFPHSKETLETQSRENKLPSDNWAVARGTWGSLVKEFATGVENALGEQGIRCCAIDTMPELSLKNSETLGKAASWSHRHSAFAAGLGTFGLSDGFISERGKAIRITSFVAEANLEVTSRGDRGHYDWCLYFKSGICGACIRRCPVRAIGEKGHDKERCREYMDYCHSRWQENQKQDGEYDEIGCGLCQTKIPCMNRKP